VTKPSTSLGSSEEASLTPEIARDPWKSRDRKTDLSSNDIDLPLPLSQPVHGRFRPSLSILRLQDLQRAKLDDGTTRRAGPVELVVIV
jgi:hypothetical protein